MGDLGDTPYIPDRDEAVLSFTFNDGGAALIIGAKKPIIYVPFACTITSVKLFADQTGSFVADIWKDAKANHPPTGADSICASAKPSISSGIWSEDSTLTGWDKSLSVGDILKFNIDSVTTITVVTLVLEIIKT